MAMNDQQKISRRDWFRLRKPEAENSPETHRRTQAMGTSSAGLEPVPHPVNHDGMDLAELPPMREAMLSTNQVQQLFADIESLASDILLMQRASPAQRATAARATSREQLAVAQAALLSGAIPRVQLRYRWQDANWIDTLEQREGRFRLVRIMHANGLNA